MRRLATETKQAFKTTEFWAFIGITVLILLSAAMINGGDNGTDEFIAKHAWLYVAIVTAAYLISRGLAKAGSRDPYWDRQDTDGDGEGLTERVKAAATVLTEGQGAVHNQGQQPVGSAGTPGDGTNRV